ncbi:unnamed protein product [Thelazia callipaeda]|uniref:SXP/RAL-2 family protein Ani s 5-like cation-binding domain-containing protein n=1 Tax=Thelazia callipaeda TaxID=103827 RepID=A0A0N5DAQ0_THECL|nr:unnamed protein product [Thelazia callipaeda]
MRNFSAILFVFWLVASILSVKASAISKSRENYTVQYFFSIRWEFFELDWWKVPVEFKSSNNTNDFGTRRNSDGSKSPYNRFGHHYEYVYETPTVAEEKPKLLFSYGICLLILMLYYKGSIGPNSNTHQMFEQIGKVITYQPKKQSIYQKPKRLNDSSDVFPMNHSKMMNINHIAAAIKESNDAQKRAQKEYETVRQLADEIFSQAEQQLSRFPTFDIPRFQQIFLNEAISSPQLANKINLNKFPVMHKNHQNFAQNTHNKFKKKRNRRKDVRNTEHKIIKSAKKYEKLRNTNRKKWNKKKNADASYRMFGILPDFDPRFPFDRAYRLMEDLRPSELWEFLPETDNR